MPLETSCGMSSELAASMTELSGSDAFRALVCEFLQLKLQACSLWYASAGTETHPGVFAQTAVAVTKHS